MPVFVATATSTYVYSPLGFWMYKSWNMALGLISAFNSFFTSDTKIRYTLSEDVVNANLYIYNMQGTQIKNISGLSGGAGVITINGRELKAGMYIYTLIADGKEVDTKRMILTD